jgi:hypothetical protein
MDEADLAAADKWAGDGAGLARRVLAYAEQLRIERLDAGPKAEIADELAAIVGRTFNPMEESR